MNVGETSERVFDLKQAIRPGIQAAKHNWAPFLLIQIAAALLVLAYYRSPWLQDATLSLQRLKAGGGPGFDIASGSISGGLLPQAAKVVVGKVKRFDRAFWLDMLFNAFVYSIIALEVDYFYQLQAHLFGTGIDWVTLVKKTSLDMFVFSTVLSIPTAVALFEWRKVGFSTSRLVRVFGNRFYRLRVMPAMIPCWAFWIPVLFCVYALPPNLQFPLSQLAEASWCLLFVFIATSE